MNWVDCLEAKPVPPHIADYVALEKQVWWKKFSEDERRAMKAMFDKLLASGINIYKQTKSPCHLLTGKDTATGFDVTGCQCLPLQLINSPLNIKKWRVDHRLMRQMFKLYLKKTRHVRFMTMVVGPVKLADLGPAITALHEKIGWLANRPWLKASGLEFVLRKTELPVQNAGQAGAEEVYLHTHLAVRCSRRLGSKKWGALLEAIKKQAFPDHAPHDAGDIKDEDRQPNYLFKNPLSAYGEDPTNPNTKLLNFERLEILTAQGTVQLYEALKRKHLVQPMGEFEQFVNALKQRADKAGNQLTLRAEIVGNHIQVKLVRVPKPKPRVKGQAPPVNLVVKKLPGKRIVRGYNGATHLPNPKPYTKVDNLQQVSLPANSRAGRLLVNAKLIDRVAAYVQKLGRCQFITREIEIGRAPDFHSSYGHWVINAVLEAIPWIKRQRRINSAGQTKSVGRGEWRRWKVNSRHPSYPKLHRRPKIDPATFDTPPVTVNYILSPIDYFAPGYWRANRDNERKARRRK